MYGMEYLILMTILFFTEISLAIAASATRTLGQIHSQGFAHGDIQLHNLVLGHTRGSDTVMVIDLARASPGASEAMRVQEAREVKHLLAEHLHRTDVVAEGQGHSSLYDSVTVS
jgi:tRNA A-37 threonylcarbamoyl transferase component Bud32